MVKIKIMFSRFYKYLRTTFFLSNLDEMMILDDKVSSSYDLNND